MMNWGLQVKKYKSDLRVQHGSAKYFCKRQGAEVRIDWSVVIPHGMNEN